MLTRRLVAPLVLGAVGVLLWSLLAPVAGPQVLPGPGAVVSRLWLELTAGGLLGHAVVTLGVSVLGCVFGVAIAFPLGYLIAHIPVVSAAIGPYLAASQAIPAVALAPLLVVWVGYGALPTALLCTLMVFFPITINTVLGFTRLDPDIIGAARVDGAGQVMLLTWIEFPLALPAILAGVRNGFVLSVTGAVVGEFVMGGQGLGQLLAVYRDRGDTAGLMAVLGALVLAAIALFGLVRLLERKLEW
ncbi:MULTISPECIES: ABC transporter permease [unclassified Pseudactinotalea]|uniref:ABC transporter permease n=1 Tax=unclassified Pseudactinotalea TaxID=2649176 RepID=UPI00128D8A8D|nr:MULTISPECIES: ABC transporter permease [unclassified Pseudactinotalea]MPV49320.1 ABC transporter permease subunit [Pseudactinotalea sp. HY160]QGH69386.1 ABC transporter permease subunit [Pseudactinotalea sp. HY158]